jgi:hypothetical protein
LSIKIWKRKRGALSPWGRIMRVYHEFLVEADGFELAKKKVLRFLDRYELISYLGLDLIEQRCVSAARPEFRPLVESGMRENRRVLAELLAELSAAGAKTLDDLAGLTQGYLTKGLHTVAHILDGFFGVDSCFYNLVDDSHWISGARMERISAVPSQYWLVAVEILYKQEEKGFEKRPPPDLGGD